MVPFEGPLEVAGPGGVPARRKKLAARGGLFRAGLEHGDFPVLKPLSIGLGPILSSLVLGLRGAILGPLGAILGLLGPLGASRSATAGDTPAALPVSPTVLRCRPGKRHRHPVFGQSIPGSATPCSRQRSRTRLMPARSDDLDPVLEDVDLVRARLPVEMQTSGRVEQFFDLRVRHLPAARAIAHEEPPAEGVRLALLGRHGDAQDLADALDFRVDRGDPPIGRCSAPAISAGVVPHADNSPSIRDADQDGPAARR